MVSMIYASYSESNQRTYNFKYKTLFYALKQIFQLKHNLKEIIVVRAYDNKINEEYYDFNFPVTFMDVYNEYYSSGQWTKYLDSIPNNQLDDYYILIEDDYTFSIDNFDKIIIEEYKRLFPQNIGTLTNIVIRRNINEIEHFESIIVLSRDSILKLRKNNKSFFQQLVDIIPKNIQGYIGGHVQINISKLLHINKIYHRTLQDKYDHLYWTNNNKNEIWIFRKNQNINKFLEEKKQVLLNNTYESHNYKDITTFNSITIPIQMLNYFNL